MLKVKPIKLWPYTIIEDKEGLNLQVGINQFEGNTFIFFLLQKFFQIFILFFQENTFRFIDRQPAGS